MLKTKFEGQLGPGRGGVYNQFSLGDIITVNHCLGHMPRQSALAGLLILIGLGVLGLPVPAHAQLSGSASVSTQYESNSNIYAQDSGYTQLGTALPHGSSTSLTYGADVTGDYSWRRQQLYVSARASKFDYEQFSQLNHYEYSLDAGLRWQLAEVLNGNVEVSRARSMVPFLDLTGSELSLSQQTNQQESFQAGLKLGSRWRLDGSATTSKSTQPAPGEPDQRMSQTSGTVSLLYAGFGPLTSGITASYLSGRSDDAIGAPDSTYRQSSAGLTVGYQLKRTSFDGSVTYSSRTSGVQRDNASGLTGSVNFVDQLTPKTSFALHLNRSINTYYVNLGSEIDSEAGLSINWRATNKISASLGYTFTYRAYPGQAVGGSDAYPVDYQQYATLSISYRPVIWLSIAPYANVQTRRSNVYGHDFDATSYGVLVTAMVATRDVANAGNAINIGPRK